MPNGYHGTRPTLLFNEGSLSEFLSTREMSARAEIGGFSSEYLLGVNIDELCAHLTDKFCVEPIVLIRDNIHIGEHGDTQIDVSHDSRYANWRGGACMVSATFATYVVPFTGDPQVFRHLPTTFTTIRPGGTIVGQELHMRFTATDHNRQSMKASFESNLQNVEQYIGWANGQICGFNGGLSDRIRQQLASRKEKFLKDRGLVEALGFPIKPRPGAAQTYAAPVIRKKLPIQKPSVASEPFKPEPRLEMEHYEHILTVVSNMIQVMERSPTAFAKMAEEDLRTHILVQLNGHYEGQATGETFNFEGKTDILIRSEGRNIFIGECKIWKGAESFKDTIDQLLGYTAWRDTKTAIILFNRNKNTSAVLAQIPDLVRKHANFKRDMPDFRAETGFRFGLHQRSDKNRELILTVLVFDVPS